MCFNYTNAYIQYVDRFSKAIDTCYATLIHFTLIKCTLINLFCRPVCLSLSQTIYSEMSCPFGVIIAGMKRYQSWILFASSVHNVYKWKRYRKRGLGDHLIAIFQLVSAIECGLLFSINKS